MNLGGLVTTPFELGKGPVTITGFLFLRSKVQLNFFKVTIPSFVDPHLYHHFLHQNLQ